MISDRYLQESGLRPGERCLEARPRAAERKWRKSIKGAGEGDGVSVSFPP